MPRSSGIIIGSLADLAAHAYHNARLTAAGNDMLNTSEHSRIKGGIKIGYLLLPLSTDMVYWVKSLVPMLKKSTSLASSPLIITAAGVSIITPIWISSSKAVFFRLQLPLCRLQQKLRPCHLFDSRDHWKHNRYISINRCTKDRTKLGLKYFLFFKGNPDSSHSHGRIGLMAYVQTVRLFLPSQIRRTDHDFFLRP